MTERTVILHYHLFKNAGTSVDRVLQRNFPGRWVTAEHPSQRADNSAAVGAWIAATPEAVAFSSHTAIGPLPRVAGVRILPLLFLRDPIDRILSAYRFERKQDAETLGTRLARSHDFEGYVRARLAIHGDRQCRNFQTHRLAAFRPGPEPEIDRALAALGEIELAGIVEDFAGSMRRIAQALLPLFPAFRFDAPRLNRSDPELAPEMSPELRALLAEANADDMVLHRALTARLAAEAEPAPPAPAAPAPAAPRPAADTGRPRQDARELARRLSAAALDPGGRYFLHIGRHKSGTSSLQRTLGHNRAALAAAGLVYPHGGPPPHAHHDIADLFAPRILQHPERITAGLASLARAADEAAGARMLLSSEAFQNAKPELVARVFPPGRTRIVVYLREQLDYAQSAYCQAVHGGTCTESFAGFLERFQPDYQRFLDRWSQAYPAGDIAVRVYSRADLAGGDIVDDFCAVLGLDPAAIERLPDDANPTIGGAALAVKLALNRLAGGAPIVRQFGYQQLIAYARERPAEMVRPCLPAGAGAAYRARFAASNRAVARAWFGREELFPTVAPLERFECSEARMLPPDPEALAAVCRHLAEALGPERLRALRAALPADRGSGTAGEGDPVERVVRDWLAAA